MGLLTAEDRALVAKAHAIKARQRKEARAARPKRVAPQRTDKPDAALRERRPRVKDKAYLQWIRRLPCLAAARRENTLHFGVDACHVRTSYPEPGWSFTGKAEKPDDARCVPMSREAHQEQHGMSEAAFWSSRLRLYPPAVCARLRAAYEAGEDGTDVILEIARWSTPHG